MHQLQSNSTHKFVHVQRFMPSRGACFVCRLCTLPSKEGPECTTPTPPTPAPPVCCLEVGSGAGELAKLSADKACVVIGVLGG